MTAVAQATDVPAAVDRAEAYRFFAITLRYPHLGELRAYLAAAQEGGKPLGEWAATLSALVDEELATEHNRLFAQGVAVNPHESGYALTDKGVLLGQLAALYECVGVRTGGTEYVTADHIGVELEFVALLCLKEAICLEDPSPEGAEALETVRAMRRIFLQEHLGRFAPLFAERLRSGSRHPFFQSLAAHLLGWLEAEGRVEGASPDSRYRQRLPVLDNAEDAETMSCPWAADDEAQPAPSIAPMDLGDFNVAETDIQLPPPR